MQYFLGIVPPETIYKPMIKIQRQFGDNRTEPHITVKGPGAVPLNIKWIDQLKKIISTYEPLKIKVAGTEFFGYDVLYLAVISDDVIKLHNELVDFFKPDEHLMKMYYEGKYYTPHLTVAQTSTGYSRRDLLMMKKIMDETFEGNVIFKAEFLRIYLWDEFNFRSLKFEDIPFKGCGNG